MNSHKNARLTFEGRRILVSRIIHEGLSVRKKAQGVSPRTAYEWLRRFREEGETSLYDRSSRPRRSPRRTHEDTRRRVVELRRRRWPYHAIAEWFGTSKILWDEGLNRLSVLEPKPPPKRFEVKAPGVLLHLDTKKLARFKRSHHRVTPNRKDRNCLPVWSYVFAAVDDHSRLAYVEVEENERKESRRPSCSRRCATTGGWGIRIRAVMTDNARTFQSKRFQRVLRRLGIRHKTTPPYTPRVNGKVERFIRTLLSEWAYAHAYQSSEEPEAYPSFPSGCTTTTDTGLTAAWATRPPSYGWGLG